MSNLKLLRTILRLKSLKITHFRFLHREKELHLAVKPMLDRDVHCRLIEARVSRDNDRV